MSLLAMSISQLLSIKLLLLIYVVQRTAMLALQALY